MPIYEYECQHCGAVFEDVGKVDADNPDCPFCNTADTRKLPTAATFRYADHWQQQHLGALNRSLERDAIKKEAQKQVGL